MYAIRSYYAMEEISSNIANNASNAIDTQKLSSEANKDISEVKDASEKSMESVIKITRITSYNVCYTKLLRSVTMIFSRPFASVSISVFARITTRPFPVA